MMKFHVFYGSNGKDSSQRCKLSNWCKGLSVIQVRFLRESLCNNPCFVALNRAICILLNLENPLRSNTFPALGKRNQLPSVVCQHLSVLFESSLFPYGPVITLFSRLH